MIDSALRPELINMHLIDVGALNPPQTRTP